MALDPQFAATPFAAQAQVSTANTARDGTGTIGTVKTAGASGSKIERVQIKAVVTTTAGMLRLFLHDGTTARLFREILVAAITASATVAAFESEQVFEYLVIPSGWSLRASTEKAEAINVIAIGGDL